MKNNFDEQLRKCETLKQVFDVVNDHYETNEEMGLFSRNLIRRKFPVLIKAINLKPKK